jgi:methionine synthase II (cobalamin-independent)
MGSLLTEYARPVCTGPISYRGRDIANLKAAIEGMNVSEAFMTAASPGVISTTNFIEHPELVVQRLERYASVVGRENVIAGTDCGFATFAGSLTVDPGITWAKLASMGEGAQIASHRLW